MFASSFRVSFRSSSRNFNKTFLNLGFGVGSNSGINSSSKSGSNSSSNFGSKFFIGNNLNSLRNFSLAVKDNPMLLSNQVFWIHFIPLSILFNSLSKFFCSLSAYSNHKIGKGYSMKL